MSLDVRSMSPEEMQFLRVYALCLKRQYSLFISALNMMRASELNLKCPVEAARLARGLQELHSEFEQTIAELTRGNKFRVKLDKVERPTPDELVQIIQVSFFKLVDSPQEHKPPEDLGWFSGHPLEWEKAWKTAHKIHIVGPAGIATALIHALANLFGIGYSAKLKQPPDEFYEEPDEDDDYYENNEYDEDDY